MGITFNGKGEPMLVMKRNNAGKEWMNKPEVEVSEPINRMNLGRKLKSKIQEKTVIEFLNDYRDIEDKALRNYRMAIA